MEPKSFNLYPIQPKFFPYGTRSSLGSPPECAGAGERPWSWSPTCWPSRAPTPYTASAMKSPDKQKPSPRLVGVWQVFHIKPSSSSSWSWRIILLGVDIDQTLLKWAATKIYWWIWAHPSDDQMQFISLVPGENHLNLVLDKSPTNVGRTTSIKSQDYTGWFIKLTII